MRIKDITTMESRAGACSKITEDYTVDIDETYFNQEYGYKAIPVIIKRAFNDWEIRKLWTLTYLERKSCGHIEPLQRSFSASGNRRLFKFSDYLQYLKMEEDYPYYFSTQMHLYNSELWKDFSAPSIFKCWYRDSPLRKSKTFLSWLFVGPRGSGTDVHQDVWNTSAWNYLIKGRKLWFFYPPSYNIFIRERPSEFDFSALLMSRNNIKPLVIEQHEGEMIFTPANWYHGVINLDSSISITENFINQTNYEYVLENFKSTRSQHDLDLLKSIVSEGFKEIDRYENPS